MKLHGIKDLLGFLNLLEAQKVFYRIEKMRSEAVMVTFTLVGERIEIEFFDDHIEYSIFSGSEAVLDDQDQLFKLISSHI